MEVSVKHNHNSSRTVDSSSIDELKSPQTCLSELRSPLPSTLQPCSPASKEVSWLSPLLAQPRDPSSLPAPSFQSEETPESPAPPQRRNSRNLEEILGLSPGVSQQGEYAYKDETVFNYFMVRQFPLSFLLFSKRYVHVIELQSFSRSARYLGTG